MAAAAEKTYEPTLPPALKKQIADVEKLYEKPQEEQNTPPAPSGDVEPGAEQQTPPQAPVQGDGDADKPAPPQPGSAAASAGDDFEQLYKSTKGRLEKANKDNQLLLERLNGLEQTIATMQASGATAKQPAAEETFESLITPEEREEYGDQLMDVIARRAKEAVHKDLAALQRENEQLKERLDGVATVQSKNAVQTLYQKLDASIPNWREINRDERFLDWLDEADPYSGEQRKALLQKAFTGQDANRVINFFRGFISVADGAPQNTQAPGNQAPPAQAPGSGGKPALEEFAAPGRARTAPQSEVPAEKPIHSVADFSKFMADKIAGKWKGREKEADAYERDFFQAQKEGRIKR